MVCGALRVRNAVPSPALSDANRISDVTMPASLHLGCRKAGLSLLLLAAGIGYAWGQPTSPPTAGPDTRLIEETVERAKSLPNLRSLIVTHNGTVLTEQALS